MRPPPAKYWTQPPCPLAPCRRLTERQPRSPARLLSPLPAGRATQDEDAATGETLTKRCVEAARRVWLQRAAVQSVLYRHCSRALAPRPLGSWQRRVWPRLSIRLSVCPLLPGCLSFCSPRVSHWVHSGETSRQSPRRLVSSRLYARAHAPTHTHTRRRTRTHSRVRTVPVRPCLSLSPSLPTPQPHLAAIATEKGVSATHNLPTCRLLHRHLPSVPPIPLSPSLAPFLLFSPNPPRRRLQTEPRSLHLPSDR